MTGEMKWRRCREEGHGVVRGYTGMCSRHLPASQRCARLHDPPPCQDHRGHEGNRRQIGVNTLHPSHLKLKLSYAGAPSPVLPSKTRSSPQSGLQ